MSKFILQYSPVLPFFFCPRCTVLCGSQVCSKFQKSFMILSSSFECFSDLFLMSVQSPRVTSKTQNQFI